MARLFSGAGLRLLECLRLRVQDMDVASHQRMLREGKRNKDRRTMLLAAVQGVLTAHLAHVRQRQPYELVQGFGRGSVPDARQRTYPHPNSDWGWPWVFPASQMSLDPRSGERRRHQLHDWVRPRAPTASARPIGLTTPASCHTRRHACATHLLADRYDIRPMQERLGHRDVKTTMIDTHVLHRGGPGVYSPKDRL
jgi:integrase